MPHHWYLAPDRVPQEYDPQQPIVVAITNFITSFILYSAFKPLAGRTINSTHAISQTDRACCRTALIARANKHAY
jgi:hypothetical protein